MKTWINASGKPVLSLSVRDLVGFLLRSGSITGSSSRSYGDRLSEGKEIHSKFQRNAKEKNEYLKQLMKKEEHLQKKVDEKIRRKEEMTSYEKLFKLKYDNNGYLA